MFPLVNVICMHLSRGRTHRGRSVVVPGVTGVILTLTGAGTVGGRGPKVFMVLLGVTGGQGRHWVKVAAVLSVLVLHGAAVPPLVHWRLRLAGAAPLPRPSHL